MDPLKPRSLVFATSLVAMLAIAPPAFAVERFASTSGLATGNCDTEAAACTLERAVETVAVDGDVVTVLPGDYAAGTAPGDELSIVDAIVVRGKPGAARPKLTSQADTTAITLTNASAVLRRFEVLHDNTAVANGKAIGMTSGTLEQVIATETDTESGSAGCNLNGLSASGALIRDTVCRNTGSRQGLRVANNAGSVAVTVRNATLIATDAGGADVGNAILANSVGAGTATNVDIANTILSSGNDVNAQNTAGGTTTVTLANSNYSNEVEVGGAAITNPGSGTNQMASPIFTNALAGDFHQAPGSPTINAGSAAVSSLGTIDVDGDPRAQGPAPDIGADEVNVDSDGDGVVDANDACPTQAGPVSNGGCPVPAGDSDGGDTGGGNAGGGATGGGAAPDTDDPETVITKKPKQKLAAGDAAKVGFRSDEDDATFECKVGKGKFKTCTSPRRLKDLEKGKTRFQVRAIDGAGNVDPTPAKATIEVGGSDR